jgi:Zn-dependent membrane protease YugP
MAGIYLLGLLLMGLGMLVSGTLKSKFEKYSKLHLANGLTGRQIAEKMLADHGITDVKVISAKGQLTDHYNPADKTVNLSESVYGHANAAAAAVAAHECGHAVQHATAYSWLQFRSSIVPVVSIMSQWVQWVLLAGILLLQIFPPLLLVGIALLAILATFAIITLPVEYDASNRALAWIKHRNIVDNREYEGAKDALKWAALTYVVAAIGAVATLLYYLSIFMRNRR